MNQRSHRLDQITNRKGKQHSQNSRNADVESPSFPSKEDVYKENEFYHDSDTESIKNGKKLKRKVARNKFRKELSLAIQKNNKNK